MSIKFASGEEMNKENNNTSAKAADGPVRITRARSRVLGASKGVVIPSKYAIQEPKTNAAIGAKPKRAASDNNGLKGAAASAAHPSKKRAVLKDVTNTNFGKAVKGHDKDQIVKKRRQIPKQKKLNTSSNATKTNPSLPAFKESEVLETSGAASYAPHAVPLALKPSGSAKLFCKIGDLGLNLVKAHHSRELVSFEKLPKRDGRKIRCNLGALKEIEFEDIDSKHKDPLMCALYAPEIYNYQRVAELAHRVSHNYMEKQRDVNQIMRGVLVDWLIEVSEEFQLVPDTLYLTVSLIDRFLSINNVPRQKLQLLGVTCMFIASKYEEIFAHRVEEFCVITDNAYTKEEVLQMERKVLSSLNFHLSVPTPKTFLRRFSQVANACWKVPGVELELLANYLAELTLTDYGFVNYLPSLVAASALFLARWTLDQSNHPWNPMLEHYTGYNKTEMKTVVLKLQSLQLTAKAGALGALREKHKLQKFKCVATLNPANRFRRSLSESLNS